MKITVLIDNRALNKKPALYIEHGLSFHIEHNNLNILCDMGASSLYAENAKALGVDVSKCDFAFISHGHNDHCGGLEHFLENTQKTEVYLHSSIPGEEYYSTRRGNIHDLNINHKVFQSHKERFRFLHSTTKLNDGVYAIQCRTNIYPTPYGNCFLWKRENNNDENDNFNHELSLAFVTDNGLVIISPCSHCGALNIIHECKRATGCNEVYAYIGGLHFVEGDTCTDETTSFVNTLKKEYPGLLLFTGHCTCDTAKKILEEGTEKVSFFSTGDIIEV